MHNIFPHIQRPSAHDSPTSPRPSPSTQLRTGLYTITDGPRDDLLAAARAALTGGAAMLQYRDKTRDTTRRLREACSLVALCSGFGVPLIVNDDVELARASGAAGVHLGENDARVAEARAALDREAIIGISCYDSLQRAADATAAGADYLAFGAFFPTTTKTVTRHATTDLLRKAKAFGPPLVAIGGITPDNGGSLVDAGADFLAVVSGVFGAFDVCAAAQQYKKLFDTDKGG